MRASFFSVACISLATLVAHSAVGQQRHTLLGQVKDAVTGQPVARGEARVLGTGARDSLRANGVFLLAVPAGPCRLVVTSGGYRPDTLEVPAGEDVLAVRLRPAPVQLGRVLVRGDTTPVSPDAPLESVQELLRASPGADVQQNSGTPGASLQVRLEGVTTLLGNTRPLWVLDGVILNDEALPSGITAVTGGLHADTPSRILDLNPNDVARIELLQGPAATARYGSQGANGVVVITTKRGSPAR